MFRQSLLALGLMALSVALASAPARPAWAQGPAHKAEKAAGETSHTTKPEAAEEKFVKASEATEPGHEGADLSHGKTPNIMEVQSPLALWTVVTFVGLLLILGRFAWGPLMKALHERESHLEQVLLDTERARNEAEAAAAEHRRQLDRAADEVRALIEQARKEGLAAGDSIVKRSMAEAEANRARATREIAGAKDQALMEIHSETANLAVAVAGKLLGRELGESDHRRLVEAAIHDLPAAPGGARA